MTREEPRTLDRALTRMLVLWVGATVVFLVVNGLVAVFGGPEAFEVLISKGPLTNLQITFASVTVVWLTGGAALAVFRRPAFRSRHGVIAVCSLLVVLLYANVLRERLRYPDTGDYIAAAVNLHLGEPLHPRYLYPPLLAVLLEPLVPLGQGTMRAVFWVGNLAAVGAFVWLLALALERYGFDRRLAAGLVLLFAAVNTPVLRTLAYGQVNLHLANLVLLALLAFPRLPVWSALALALAVHLKTSPVIFAPLFAVARSWRWVGAFVIWMLAVAGVIYAIHGAQPFTDFVGNTAALYDWSGHAYRENSIDKLLRSTTRVLGEPFAFLSSRVALLLAKGGALALAAAVAAVGMWRGTFAPRGTPGAPVINGWPAISVAMVLASPLFWVHHAVFLAIPFLVLVRRLRTAWEWALYVLAYAFEFLLPTFSFYPWSFGRLVGLFIVLGLLYRVSDRREDGELFTSLTRLLRIEREPGTADP